MHLVHQVLCRGKAPVGPQAPDKLDLEQAAAQTPYPLLPEIDLHDTACVPVEGRLAADIGHAWPPASEASAVFGTSEASAARAASGAPDQAPARRVHTIRDERLVLDTEIGRRKAKLSAAAFAAHHDTQERNAPAQKAPRRGKVASLDELADARAADDAAARDAVPQRKKAEAKAPRGGTQGRHIALRPPSKDKVFTDIKRGGLESPDEDIAHEGLGRKPCHRPVELQDITTIDALPFQQEEFVRQGGQVPDGPRYRKRTAWVARECHHRGYPVAFAGGMAHIPQHAAVSAVHAVEDPDGHNLGLPGPVLKRTNAVYDSH